MADFPMKGDGHESINRDSFYINGIPIGGVMTTSRKKKTHDVLTLANVPLETEERTKKISGRVNPGCRNQMKPAVD